MTGVGNLVTCTVWSKGFFKTEPTLSVRLNRTDGEQSVFGSLNEVTSMRHCISGLSNREVTMYR
jgi:hypothetical protein